MERKKFLEGTKHKLSPLNPGPLVDTDERGCLLDWNLLRIPKSPTFLCSPVAIKILLAEWIHIKSVTLTTIFWP